MTSAQGFLDISVLVSTTDKDSATMSAEFDQNYGSDATWVIKNQLIQLPAQPTLVTGATGPRPANISFPFTVPWAYGLTPVTQGQPAPDNLLVEIHIHSQPGGSYRIDNLSSCTAPTSSFGMVGTACHAAGMAPVELESNTSMQAGNPYAWQLSNAEPGMPFMLAMNLTDQGGLLGNPAWPLPYPLFDPANPSQPSQALALAAFTGSAPDCYINVDLAATLGGVMDANGEGTVSVILPPGRQYVGLTLYTQAIVFSQTANPLLLISSAGHASTICGPLGVSRVYQFYNGGPTVTPPTSGTLTFGLGPVIEVQ